MCRRVYEWLHLCGWGCEVGVDPHKASQALLQSRAKGSQGLVETLGLVHLQRTALLVQAPHCLAICHLQAQELLAKQPCCSPAPFPMLQRSGSIAGAVVA